MAKGIKKRRGGAAGDATHSGMRCSCEAPRSDDGRHVASAAACQGPACQHAAAPLSISAAVPDHQQSQSTGRPRASRLDGRQRAVVALAAARLERRQVRVLDGVELLGRLGLADGHAAEALGVRAVAAVARVHGVLRAVAVAVRRGGGVGLARRCCRGSGGGCGGRGGCVGVVSVVAMAVVSVRLRRRL